MTRLWAPTAHEAEREAAKQWGVSASLVHAEPDGGVVRPPVEFDDDHDPDDPEDESDNEDVIRAWDPEAVPRRRWR